MAIEDLKVKCERLIKHVEEVSAEFGRDPNDSKSYQESKLILELINKAESYDKMFATREFQQLSISENIDWSNSAFSEFMHEIIKKRSGEKGA